jgi:hypothetical protein
MSIGGGASSTPLRPELLLKPEDALLLGQVHRLVTSQGACLPSARRSLFVVAQFLRSG